jgi:hypothetical protein
MSKPMILYNCKYKEKKESKLYVDLLMGEDFSVQPGVLALASGQCTVLNVSSRVFLVLEPSGFPVFSSACYVPRRKRRGWPSVCNPVKVVAQIKQEDAHVLVSSDFQRKGSSPAKGFLKPSSVVAPTQLLPTLLGMDDKKGNWVRLRSWLCAKGRKTIFGMRKEKNISLGRFSPCHTLGLCLV